MESRLALRRRIEDSGLTAIEATVAGKLYLIVGISLEHCETVSSEELLDYWV